MISLRFQDLKELVPLILHMLKPTTENYAFPKSASSFSVLILYLSIDRCPLLEHLIEPLHLLSSLKLFDPELPLLYASLPLYQRLFGTVDCVKVNEGFLDLSLEVPQPPLLEEDRLHFGLEHALEYKLGHPRGQPVLNVVGEACEGLLIHNIVRVGSDAHHEVMGVADISDELRLILKG